MKHDIPTLEQTKIIVVYYPAGAGGKFLTAMLGLSDSCLLMNYNSIIESVPLGKLLTYREKQDLILSQLDLVKEWNDFGIFTEQLFRNHDLMCVPDLCTDINILPVPKIVSQMAKTNKVLFMCIHNPYILHMVSNIWKNLSVIVFKNSEKFIDRYRKNKVLSTDPYEIVKNYYQYTHHWGNVKGANYPERPPSRLFDLALIRNRICRDFGDEFYFELENKIISLQLITNFEKTIIDNLSEQNKTHSFDTNLYFDTSNTIDEIKILYEKFNLDPIAFNDIIVYHQKWLEAIDFSIKISGDDSNEALIFEETVNAKN